MKNIIITCIIFIIMVFIMIFSLSYLNKVCTNMLKTGDELEKIILKGDWEKADNISNEYLKNWEGKSYILPMFVNHTEIDLLNNEMLRLTQYVRCQNKEEALASTHTIKFYLDNIKELQKINIQNIF